MQLDKQDIKQSKDYLLNLITEGIDLTDIDLEDPLLDAIIDILINETEDNEVKKPILTTIKLLPAIKQAILKKKLLDDIDFQNDIKKVFQLEQRKSLKEKLIQSEENNTDYKFDEEIRHAFKLQKRKELKQNLKDYELEVASKIILGKRDVFSRYLKIASVAAIIVISLLLWQPTKINNKDLFTYCISGQYQLPQINDFGFVTQNAQTRGNDFVIEGLTQQETESLLAALEFIENQNYSAAKKILVELTSKEKNPDLLIYLSISELNTNDISAAIDNLEYLNDIPKYQYKSDVQFYLALCYIKNNKNTEARKILHSLLSDKNKYSQKSKEILRKLRWF